MFGIRQLVLLIGLLSYPTIVSAQSCETWHSVVVVKGREVGITQSKLAQAQSCGQESLEFAKFFNRQLQDYASALQSAISVCGSARLPNAASLLSAARSKIASVDRRISECTAQLRRPVARPSPAPSPRATTPSPRSTPTQPAPQTGSAGTDNCPQCISCRFEARYRSSQWAVLCTNYCGANVDVRVCYADNTCSTGQVPKGRVEYARAYQDHGNPTPQTFSPICP